MSSTPWPAEGPADPSPHGEVPRMLAQADAYLAELAQTEVPPVRGLLAFIKAVMSVRVRDQMLAEARRIATERPELAARLRQAARGGWVG